jgi:DNA-binding MarR family transcriptional regulator
MRPTDAVALHHLARGPLTPSELGERLGAGSGSVTAIVDRLEAAGHVARHPHPTDRRSLRLELTSEGSARTREQLDGFITAAIEAASRLSADERTVVGRFLDELSGIVEAEAPRGPFTSHG